MRWRRKKQAEAVAAAIAVDAMEPRVLLSADALGIDSGVIDADRQDNQPWDIDRAADWWAAGEPGVDADADTAPVDPSQDDAQARREVVFLDAGVDDGEALLDDLLAGNENAEIQVFLIDGANDGVGQIAAVLANQHGLDAVHIISHGTAGQIQLGNTTLSTGSLNDYAGQLNDWGSALSEDADILFYGCDLAADEQGRALVDAIGVMTGADVAASVDQTGHAAHGGDWDLEYRAGLIDATLGVAPYAPAQWTQVLELHAYEGFDYGAGTLDDASGGTGWATAWSNEGADIDTVTTGLQSGGGLLGETGGAAELATSGGFETVEQTRQLSTTLGADGTTTWVSWLFEPGNTGGNDYLGMQFGDGSGLSDRLWAGYHNDDITLETGDSSGTFRLDNLVSSGNTYLLALKMEFKAGDDDFTLYFDPTPGLSSPDSLHVAGVKSDLDLGTFTQISIAGGWGTNPAIIDEIRVGDSFADVTPGSAAAAGEWTLHIATKNDVSGGGQPGNDDWQEGDLVAIGDPNLDLGPGTTNGSFSVGVDVDAFAPGIDLGAAHVVSKNVELGTSGFQLLAGDVLFMSKSSSETFTSNNTTPMEAGFSATVVAAKEDLVLYRPDTAGDYSTGAFKLLLEDVSGAGHEIHAITLVEKGVDVGGTTLEAGDFLYATAGGGGIHENIYLYQTGTVGAGATPTDRDVFLAGGDTKVGIGEKYRGLELLEEAATIGGHYFSAGTLLAHVDGDVLVGDNDLDVDHFDVFALTVTHSTLAAGAGNGEADATMLFDGSQVAFDDNNDEKLDAIALTPTAGIFGGHYLDRFDTDGSYAGDNGSLSWTNNWQEIGGDAGAGAGDTRVIDEFAGDGGGNVELRFRDNNYAWREADLSGATSATLSFDYALVDLEAGDDLVVYAQTGGGTGGVSIADAPGTWDEIGRFSGPADDGAYIGASIDLSGYIASDTRILFHAEQSWNAGDNIFVDNVRIDLATSMSTAAPTTSESALWMSTSGNVGPTSGAPGLNAWKNGEVIQLGDPNLALEPDSTDGTFSSIVNLDIDGSISGTNLDLDALHYVTRDLTTPALSLQQGDLLFSTNGQESLPSAGTVERDDIILFRPDTPGDYSSGSFSVVVPIVLGGGPTEPDLKAMTLIEQDMAFGDTTLTAGDFLVVDEDDPSNIYLYRTVSATLEATPLITGSEVGITAGIDGLELVESNTTLGDETLAAGELLISVDALDSGIGTSNITADEQDIFRLQVVKTTAVTGTSVADAALLVNGGLVGLDTAGEDLDALTMVSSGTATAPPTSTLTVTTTDDTLGGDTSSVSALIADPGGDNKISLREAIIAANNTDGLNTIEFNIAGSGPHIINLAAELPEITGTLIIDGTSEPDYSDSPVIGINGVALTNDDGFRLMSGSEGSTIRGLAVANFADGDAFDIRTGYNTIVGNHIGLLTDGVTAAGNDTGVKLHNGADFNTIGGTDTADRNLISGNTYSGVSVIGNNTNDNLIIGNWIGLDKDGDVVSAGDHGVVIWNGSYDNQVGGANPGEGNRIAGHNNGVNVSANTIDSLHNTILGNEIFSVNEMAIDLGNDQITANDVGDGDDGPNDLLNHPELTSVVRNGADLVIDFDLDVPNGNYRIEFFENPAGIGGIGLGEGQVFLGAVTISHPGGSQSFSETLAGVTATARDTITATATVDFGDGDYGSTSEFSAPAPANTAPIAQDDSYSTIEDTNLVVGSGSDLLDNDTDADGDTLTAEVTDGPDNGVLVFDPVGLGTETPLGSDPAFDHHARWSPDGSKIAFTSERGAGGDRDIYVMNADGTGVTPLTTDGSFTDEQPVWSPDGSKLAITSDRFGDKEILIIDATDGSLIDRLTTDGGADQRPTWSPDGTQIAWTSDRDGNFDIWVANADGSGVPSKLTTSSGDDSQPVWSPDGSKILFVSTRAGGNEDIWVMDADGGNETRLTNDGGSDRTGSWSPDGSKIFFTSNRSGNFDIWVMDADGSNERLVEATAGDEYWTEVSADGTKLLTMRDFDIYETTLQFDGTFTYIPDAGFSGTDSFSYVASDGADNSNVATAAIFVDGVPEFDVDGPFSVDEGAAVGTVVGDVDANNGEGGAADAGVTYGITGNLDTDGDGRNAFAIDQNTGEITVNDADDLDYENDPSMDITVEADDGTNTIETTVTIDLNNVNEAPTVRTPTPVFINEIHYDNVDVDTAEAIEIAGVAGNDLNGWTLVMYNGFNGTVYDTVNLSGVLPNQDDNFGTLAFSFPENGIQNATSGNPDGVALVDPRGTVVQFLSYEGVFTATEGPANGMESTDIGVSEDNGTALGDSLQLTGNGATFTWAAAAAETFGGVNNGQDFAAIAAASVQAVNEEENLVFSVANGNQIVVGDVDAALGAAADPLSVTLSVANGTLTLGSTAGLGSVSGDGSNSVTITGTAAELNAAMDGLVYTSVVDYNGSDTLTVLVNDQGNEGLGGAQTASGAVFIRVDPVNDAPTISGPSEYGVDEDDGYRLLQSIVVDDVDAGGADLELTVTVDHGVLLFTTVTGLTSVTGNDSASVTLVGSVAELNTALDSLNYKPDLDFNGTDNLAIALDDLGNTGPGNLTDTKDITITVDPVDDAPTFGGDTSGTGNEDGGAIGGTLTAADTADGMTTPDFTISAVASNGTASIDAVSGVWSYTPDPDFNGSDSFTVQVTDDDGNTATQVIDITVNPVNDNASFSGDTSGTGDEDAGDITGTLSVSDAVDGMTTPNFRIEAGDEASNGTASIDAAGNWTYTPAADFNGSDSFTVSVTDDDGHVETQVIDITVSQVDDNASFGGDTSGTGNEDGGAIGGTLTASDAADGMTTPDFTVSAVATNGTASIDAVSGVWSYTPDPDFNGSDSFTVQVTDDDGNTATQVISITVDPVNDNAAFSGDTSGTGDEDGGDITGTLSVSDAVDGMTTPSFRIEAGDEASNGTASIDAAGNWTYTPAANFNGSDSFTVSVTDDDGHVETQVISITVNPTDDPVTLGGDLTGTGDEDAGAITGTLTATDAIDGLTDGTYFTVSNDGGNGTATIDPASGVWSYTPDPDFNGTDSFEITITDDDDHTTTQVISITVDPVDDPVTLGGDITGTGDEDGGAITGTLTATDTADGLTDGTYFTVSTDGTNGTATIDPASGAWSYIPDPDFNGTDSFEVTVTDDDGHTAIQVISITVDPIDDPVAIGGDTSGTGDEDTNVSGTLTAIDNADGLTDGSVFSITGTAGNGSATIDPTSGQWTYTPSADFNGSDSFEVTVTDDDGFTETQVVDITMNPVVDIVDDGLTTDEDTSIAANVLTGTNGASADDFEGTPVLTGVTQGSNGSVTFDGAGNITYTPDANFHGSDSFSYTITSGGVTETATVDVTVNPIDDAVVIAGDLNGAGDEDAGAITGTLTATDTADGLTDGTVFTVSTGAGNGTATIDPASGDWSYSPDPDFNGTDSFEVTVTDDDGFAATQLISITVNPTDDPVTLGGDITGAGDEDGGAISGTLTATDTADGLTDGSYFTISSDGTNGTATIDPASGVWSYTPDPDFNGTDSFEITVTDDDDHTATQVIDITVNPAVDIVDDSLTTSEDTPITANVLTGTNGASADNFEGAAVLTGVTQGTNGSVTFLADGTVTYTPDPDFNGSDSFTYTISSGGVTETATVDVTVNPANDPTVISGDTGYAGDEGDTVTGTLSATDPDGLTDLTYYTVKTQGTYGTANIDAETGAWGYTPASADWFGTDQFTVTVTDDLGGETDQIISITLANIDDAPSIGGDTGYVGVEGDTATGTLTASDADGMTDLDYFSIKTQGSNGTATIDAETGAWTFSPTDSNWFGTDSFTVTVTDDEGGAVDQTISITLASVDDPVTIAGDTTGTGAEDTDITGTLIATDTADGLTDGTVFTVSTGAGNGIATIDPASGAWTYTPDPDFNGSDSFEVTITDDDGYSVIQAISVTVNAVDDAASFGGDTSGTGDEDGGAITGTLTASDTADGMTTPDFTVIGAASNGTAAIDAVSGAWSYTPNANFNGPDSFTVQVTDDDGNTATQVISITVDPVDDPTGFGGDTAGTGEEDGGAITGILTANDPVDGMTTPDFTVVGGASNGTASIDAVSGAWSYTPDPSFNGADSFTVRVTDDAGNTATQVIDLTVNPSNDAPVIGNNSMTLNAGDTVVIKASILSASDVDDAAGGLTFSVSGVSGGQFERLSAPGVSIGSFTQAEVAAGQIVFVDDGDKILPTYAVSVSDGAASIGPFAAKVSFVSNELLDEPTVVKPEVSEVPPPEPPPAEKPPTEIEPEPEVVDEEAVDEDAGEVDTGEEPATEPLAGESGSTGDGVVDVEFAGLPDFDNSRTVTANGFQGLLKSLLLKPAALTSMLAPGAFAPAAELDALGAEIRSVLTSGGFTDSLNRMRDDINNASFVQSSVVGTGAAAATGLSVGYVAWLVRGGVLLSTALSSLPAWQFIDPLPVLARTNDDEEGDGADDSLESIIKNQAERDAKQDEAAVAEASQETAEAMEESPR